MLIVRKGATRIAALVLASLIILVFNYHAQSAFCQTSRLPPRELFLLQLRNPNKEINAGLTYCLELCRNDQSQLVDQNFAFQSGDGVRVHVKTNFDGYAYIILAAGTSGKRAVLFPGGSEPNNIVHGREYILPINGVLRFDDKPGREALQVVASREPIDLESFSAQNASIITSTPSQQTANQGFAINVHPRSPVSLLAYLNHGVTTASQPPVQPQPLAQPVRMPPLKKPSTVEPLSRPVAPKFPPKLPAMPVQKVAPPPVSANRPLTDKWAVLIGIKYFPGFNADTRSRPGNVRTMNIFKNYLINEAHFSPSHVCVVEDQKANKHNVQDVLIGDWLANMAQPDDLVIIYFNTHGSTCTDGKNYLNLSGEQTDNTGSVINIDETCICMQDLGEIIKSKIRSQRVVIILDACYSANVMPKELDQGLDEMLQGAGQIVVSSSEKDEESWTDARLRGNLFTTFLTENLRQNRGLLESFRRTAQQVEAEGTTIGETQIPVINYSRWRGKDVIISAPVTNARPSSAVPHPF